MKSFLALLLVLGALCFSGCRDKEPVPRHVLVIRAAGQGYVLDGQPMAYDQVLAQLEELARGQRTSPGDAARLVLTVRTDTGVPYDHVVEIVDRCHALGINKIETGMR